MSDRGLDLADRSSLQVGLLDSYRSLVRSQSAHLFGAAAYIYISYSDVRSTPTLHLSLAMYEYRSPCGNDRRV